MTMKFGWIIAAAGIVGIAVGASLLGKEDTAAPVAPAGGAMVQIAMPQLSPTATLGQKTFNETCAACHGENAVGQEGAGPPLIHKIYEPSHHGDMSFLLAVQRGVTAHHWRFGDMPPIEGISNSRVGAIVAFVREVQQANGIH